MQQNEPFLPQKFAPLCREPPEAPLGQSKFVLVSRSIPKDPTALKLRWDSELLRRSVFTMPPILTTLWIPLRADFLEGDAMKHFSVKKRVFQWKGGEAIQWMRGLVRISTGKAIQWRASGHSLNRRTLKTEKLLSSSPSQKSALTLFEEEDACKTQEIVSAQGGSP